MSFDQVFNLIFKAIGMTGVLTSLNQAKNMHEQIGESAYEAAKAIEEQKKQAEKTKSALKGISGASADIVNKFEDMKERLEATETLLENSGGLIQNMKTRMGEFAVNFKAARQNGQSLWTSLWIGADGYNKALGTGSMLINANLAKMGIVLAGFAPLILGIGAAILVAVAAVKTLKKMFELNIGGMATRFHKFVGTLKNLTGQFDAAFSKTLMKLSPMFDVIFGAIEGIAYFVLNVLVGAFKGVWAVVEPIIDVFAEIGKAVSEAFGGAGANDMKAFATLGKIIGTTFEYVGKAIGFVIKVALTPLVYIIKTVGKVFAFLRSQIEKFLGNPVIKKVLGFFGKDSETNVNVNETGSGKAVLSNASGNSVNNSRTISNQYNNNIQMYSNSRNGTEDAVAVESMLQRQQAYSGSL